MKYIIVALLATSVLHAAELRNESSFTLGSSSAFSNAQSQRHNADRPMLQNRPAITTFYGVNVSRMNRQSIRQLKEYNQTIQQHIRSFNITALQVELSMLVKRATDSSLTVEERVLEMKKIELLKSHMKTDQMQSFLKMSSTDDTDEAKREFDSLRDHYRYESISELQWEQVQDVYYHRPEKLQKAAEIAEYCDMITTTPTMSRHRYNIDGNLSQMGVKIPMLEENLKMEDLLPVCEKYINAHLAYTASMVVDSQQISWADWVKMNCECLEEVVDFVDAVYGLGEAIVTETRDNVIYPVGTLAYELGSIVVQSIFDLFTPDEPETLAAMQAYRQECYRKFKENPREAGRQLGKNIYATIYPLITSMNPNAKKIIANAKKIVGASKGLLRFRDCIII